MVSESLVVCRCNAASGVGNDTLFYNISIANLSPASSTISLHADLSSWNGAGWHYPVLAPRNVTVGAGQTVVVHSSAPWLAGREVSLPRAGNQSAP
jgi:hypothetical protein